VSFTPFQALLVQALLVIDQAIGQPSATARSSSALLALRTLGVLEHLTQRGLSKPRETHHAEDALGNWALVSFGPYQIIVSAQFWPLCPHPVRAKSQRNFPEGEILLTGGPYHIYVSFQSCRK